MDLENVLKLSFGYRVIQEIKITRYCVSLLKRKESFNIEG